MYVMNGTLDFIRPEFSSRPGGPRSVANCLKVRSEVNTPRMGHDSDSMPDAEPNFYLGCLTYNRFDLLELAMEAVLPMTGRDFAQPFASVGTLWQRRSMNGKQRGGTGRSKREMLGHLLSRQPSSGSSNATVRPHAYSHSQRYATRAPPRPAAHC